MAHHELFAFLQETEQEIQREYERIAARSREDPGTAGDECEENWASLLRRWLPAPYHVRTKGRILSAKGDAGPQVDVVVLHPSYPPGLLDKKLYLAGAVLAVFECKLTLRRRDLQRAFTASRRVHELAKQVAGLSPYGDSCSPLIFGVLAHSHELSDDAETSLADLLLGA